MNSKNENNSFITVENFMADMPDSATREELYDLLGDDPMFSPENLAKAEALVERRSATPEAQHSLEDSANQTDSVVVPTTLHQSWRMRLLSISSVAAIIACVVVIYWQYSSNNHREVAVAEANSLLAEIDSTLPFVLKAEKQKEQCQKAMRLLSEVYGKNHSMYRSALSKLVVLNNFNIEIGNEARDALEELRTLDLALYGKSDFRYIDTLQRFAMLEEMNENVNAAIALNREIAEIEKQQGNVGSRLWVMATSDIGRLSYQGKEFENARQAYQSLVDLKRNDFATTDWLFLLSNCYLELGDNKQRYETVKTAIALQRSLDIQPSIFNLVLLGRMHSLKGEFQQAEKELLEAKRLYWETPTIAPSYPSILMSLVDDYRNDGKYKQAKSSAVEAIRMFEIMNKTHNKDYVFALISAANINMNLGEYEQAIAHITQGFDVYRKGKLNAPSLLINIYSQKSVVELLRSNNNEALAAAKQALHIAITDTASDVSSKIRARISFANVLMAVSKIDVAEKELGVAQTMLSKLAVRDYRQESSVLASLGIIKEMRGEFREAEADLKKAIAMIPKTDPSHALLKTILVQIYKDLGRVDDSRMLAMSIKDTIDRLIPKKVRESQKGKIIIVNGYPTWIHTL
ncbi:MAG: hypothetical protein QM501_10165 [Gimesia sp.]